MVNWGIGELMSRTKYYFFTFIFLGCSWWWEKNPLRKRKKKSHWICYSRRDINPMIWSKWRKKQNSPSVSQLNPGHIEFRVKSFIEFLAIKEVFNKNVFYEMLAQLNGEPIQACLFGSICQHLMDNFFGANGGRNKIHQV